MTTTDMNKLVTNKIYIADTADYLIAQITNFNFIIQDCFGTECYHSICNISEIINFYNNGNQLLFSRAIDEHADFPVWLLDRIHFRTQQLLSKCMNSSSSKQAGAGGS